MNRINVLKGKRIGIIQYSTQLISGLDIITILTIRYKIVRINHDGFRHRNKTGIRNQYDWSHRDFELL